MSRSEIEYCVQTLGWAKFHNNPLRHYGLNFNQHNDWIVIKTSICAESTSQTT